MIKERFITYVEDSIKKNWEIEALSNYREKGYSYKDIAERIIRLHIAFKEIGINEGDKIALVAKNSANWCVIYLSVVTYGAVIVPVLPDFKPEDLGNILLHSDSRALFVDDKIWETLDHDRLSGMLCTVSADNYDIIAYQKEEYKSLYQKSFDLFNQKYPELKPEHIKFSDIDNDKLAVISYTSGTTGFSKGVMIPHRSLAANTRYAQANMPLEPGDPLVSFLPLAHTYGCAFEFLFPFTYGCHITILSKTPSPQVVVQAFKEIKPRLILSVPLVIEKIYKKQLLPVIDKPLIHILLRIPLVNILIKNKICNTLNTSFGGNFKEVVIGGAAFNADAEKFFKKIGFRFSVGYGMTECGPLISYSPWNVNPLGASGRSVDTLEIAIDSEDPRKIVGEIILRGDNLMLGYYKNEDATHEVMDSEGWFHTGDLGLIDKYGSIFIKGRCKNMLLGPSGKNIYPEEIESIINNYSYVAESVVISEDNKLVALICPDMDQVSKDKLSDEQLQAALDTIRKEVNHRLPDFMGVTKFRIHAEEFAKTPKRSIKRYLYMKD
jgi:long-chain acyl-CoA synthetase